MKMKVGQAANVGMVRGENQDAMGWFTTSAGELFIVADGMGGEAGGKTAANMAVSTIREMFDKGGSSIPAMLKSSIEETNSRIHMKGTSGEPRFKKMGSTVVVLVVKDGNAYIAHEGDSRIYLFRNNNLQRLTKDHSQVQRMVDDGILNQEEAEDHPDANIITQCLGSKPTIKVDIRPQPIQIQPSDLFLLCTDGLCGPVKDQEIENILKEGNSVEKTCNKLVGTAIAEGG